MTPLPRADRPHIPRARFCTENILCFFTIASQEAQEYMRHTLAVLNGHDVEIADHAYIVGNSVSP